MAEGAIKRAANLAGYTQGAAFGIRNVNTLDLVWALTLYLTGQPQKPFACAIDRNLLCDELWTSQCVTLGQRHTQFFRHAGHFVERSESAKIQPMPQLLHTHLALRLRHAKRAQRITELPSRKTDQRRSFGRYITLERQLFDEIARSHGMSACFTFGRSTSAVRR